MTGNIPTLAAVVLSGGMDSACAAGVYAARGHRLLCVTVDYGQRHARELRSAAMVAAHYGADHVVVDVSGIGPALTGSALTDRSVPVPDGHYEELSMRATVVPNRNAILASIATGVAISRHAELLVLGVHAGDHAVYPDCRPEFITALDRLVQVGNEGFNPPWVQAPFIDHSKADIAAIGAGLGVPMHLTWSCYKGGDAHCGTCGTCVERREAFDLAGVPDPTAYAQAVTA